jgi:preprotein translocase subunit YajC
MMNEKDILTSKTIGVITAVVMFIICAIFYEFIMVQERLADTKAARNDFNNVTPGDYTVRMEFEEKTVKKMKEMVKSGTKVMEFKEQIQK